MRQNSFILVGCLALVGGLAACGDDSGGSGGSDASSTATTTSGATTGSTNPSVSSSSASGSPTSSGAGGDGGEGPGSGGAGPGSGGDGPGGGPGTGGAGTGGDGTGGAGTGGAGTGGAGTGGDGTGGAGTGGAGTGGGGAGGASCDGVELTVHNFLSWCSVSVAGEAASTASTQVVCVPEGATDLTAEGAGSFILGDDMWHHTDGDAGAGEAGEVDGEVSSAVVTVSGDTACVWVCCPFPNGTGCDPDDIGDLCQ